MLNSLNSSSEIESGKEGHSSEEEVRLEGRRSCGRGDGVGGRKVRRSGGATDLAQVRKAASEKEALFRRFRRGVSFG